jgi:2-C-methyl-D-erythritol 2,4-cyclodiphosphate synthase
MKQRIGHGYDVHRFGPGDKLFIGGVKIPHKRGLIAHSDGDVLLHALADALLGAAGLGDIGQHFPDSDPIFKDKDSRELLRIVYTKVNAKGYYLVNADLTIIAQAPKMADYIPAMGINIAQDLKTTTDAINIKATTTEQLGFIGREEGIAAHSVVLLATE